MKTKKLEKKLVLNRKTITNLDNTQLSGVQGGFTTYCVTVGRTECFTNCVVCDTRRCM